MSTPSRTAWAELVRCGGTDDPGKVPCKMPLTENPTFFGRLAKPQIPNDYNFTHENQYALECLFVSSTHFSIGYTANGENERVYTIRDFSRNGTFVDGVLVGKEAKTLVDGAEITLKYKDVNRVIYRFNVTAAVTNTQPSPAKVVNTPETNQVITSLNQQIAMLQDQAKKTDTKLVSQAAELDTVKEELDTANRTFRSQKKTIKSLQHECSEAKERYLVSESNGSALQARLQNLESRAEDAEQLANHWKSKVHACQEELKEKSTRLDELQSSLNQNNQIVTSENQARMAAEAQLHEQHAIVNMKTQQIQNLTQGNHALQHLLDESEKRCDDLLKKAELYKTMLIAMQERAQEQADKIKTTIQASQQLSTIIHTLTEQTHCSRRHADVMLDEILEFQQQMALMQSRPSTSSGPLRHATQGMEETAAEALFDLGRSQQEVEPQRINYTQVPFSCPPVAASVAADHRHRSPGSDGNSHNQNNDYTQAPDGFPFNQEQAQEQQAHEQEQEPPLLSQESHIRRASNTSPTKSSKNSTTTKASINLLALQSSQENNDDSHERLVGAKRARARSADDDEDNNDLNRTEMPGTNANDAMNDGDEHQHDGEDLDKTRIESAEEVPAAKRLKFSQQQLHRSQPAVTSGAGAHDFISPRSNASFYAVQDEDNDEDGSGNGGASLLNDDDRQRTIDERSSASFLMDHMN